MSETPPELKEKTLITGRPPDYTKEYGDQLAIELEKWMIASEDNIFLSRFALDNDFNDMQISALCKISKSFLNAVNKCKKKQELVLIQKSLKNKYNWGFAKFLLINNHGYTGDSIKSETTQKIEVKAVSYKDAVKEIEDQPIEAKVVES